MTALMSCENGEKNQLAQSPRIKVVQLGSTSINGAFHADRRYCGGRILLATSGGRH